MIKVFWSNCVFKVSLLFFRHNVYSAYRCKEMESSVFNNSAGNVAAGKVYNVTTRKEIHSLLSEYKKRKQQRSMPGKIKKDRIAKFLPKKTHPKSDDPILNEVEKQQQSSILKVCREKA